MIRTDDPPLSLSEVLNLFYQARFYVLGGLVLGCAVALLFLVLLKPQYEIWMIVAPPRQGAESVNFLVEDLPQVLAPMAGQATSRDGEYIRFKQSLRGPAVASVLIKLDGMVKGINDKSLMRGGSGSLSDAREVAHHLAWSIDLDPLADTESLRLVYHHPDPEFGLKLLRNLVKIDDQLIRLDVRKDVEARIDWLKRELKATLNPEHRQALTRLLMAEERRRMLLSIETPYAVSVIEDATASPVPVSPKSTLFLPFFGLFGMVVAFLVFYVRRQFEREL
ncbi:MAG TPA: hypothetical protein PKI93_02775 [Alphaproteobacteria bacterium]|nr:hypothetical protein [Alphaproteobacteria bacterium]HNS43901.1 hypothetical protein [Alphaproteobacteria bacterium]